MKRHKNQLHEFLRKNLELAANDYEMIQPGDRILVALSGGADSYVLLSLLNGRKIYIPDDISIIAVHLDMGFKQNDGDLEKLKTYLKNLDIEHYIEKTEIGKLAHSEHNRHNPCFMCSRLRRKRLFELAKEYGCKKIALGHHKDDIVETLLINMFYGREISTMMPKQEFFKGLFYIIRPLSYLWEKKIKQYADQQDYPLFDNNCPTSNDSKRMEIKNLLRDLSK
ncbi:tRNA lysidine(34) synthetase TilS, partial [candidate division KSB1 bacterium]|nr:tRNA lysidine(34) synthetase TilS [candidate division KSB1 bacterium]